VHDEALDTTQLGALEELQGRACKLGRHRAPWGIVWWEEWTMRVSGSGELRLNDEAGRLLMRLEFKDPHPLLTVVAGLDRNIAVQMLDSWLQRQLRDIRVGYPIR